MRRAAFVSTVLASALFVGLAACDDAGELDHSDGPDVEIEAAPPIAGGWSEAPIDDANIIQAAEFAASSGEGVALKEIIAAQSQVVAGMNYDVMIELEDGSLWQAVVYQPLEGDMELISFNPA